MLVSLVEALKSRRRLHLQNLRRSLQRELRRPYQRRERKKKRKKRKRRRRINVVRRVEAEAEVNIVAIITTTVGIITTVVAAVGVVIQGLLHLNRGQGQGQGRLDVTNKSEQQNIKKLNAKNNELKKKMIMMMMIQSIINQFLK